MIKDPRFPICGLKKIYLEDWISSPGPIWEVVEPEERDGVAVDGDGDGEHTDDVHHHARLHHVHGLERAVTENDGVGRCRHRQGEGVGANNT